MRKYENDNFENYLVEMAPFVSQTILKSPGEGIHDCVSPYPIKYYSYYFNFFFELELLLQFGHLVLDGFVSNLTL